jgi:hypothetical protein
LTIYWLAAAAPALPFLVLYMAYRRTLLGKRFTVQQVMVRKGVLTSYLNVFGRTDASAEKKDVEPNEVVDALFNLYYHWASYGFGLVLNIVITTAITVCMFIRAGINMGLAPGLESLGQGMSPAVAFGFAGAYLWNLYDLVKRYQVVDMTPASFQFCWLRLLTATIVGPLASLAAAEGIKNAVAFGFGMLPLQAIFQYFADFATKRLNIGVSQKPVAGPTLHYLQGMTADIIDRMSDEGIDSTATLAYADPMKLFLKTDIEWVVIIDIIDQALLFNYVGEKLESLRPTGIRGSIELAVIYERLVNGDKADVTQATELTRLLAQRIGMSMAEMRNLIQTVWEDGQVELLWELFGESFSDEEMDTQKATVEEKRERKKAVAAEAG